MIFEVAHSIISEAQAFDLLTIQIIFCFLVKY